MSANDSLMTPREAFLSWINSDKPTMRTTNGAFPAMLLKLDKTEDVVYVFKQDLRGISDKIKGPLRNLIFEYFCLYDKKHDVICSNSRMPEVLCKLERGDYAFEEDLRERLQDSVRSMVESRIANDRNNLSVQEVTDSNLLRSLEYYQEFGAIEDAKRHLFADGALFDTQYECSYEFSRWTDDELISFIDDPDGFAKAQADAYIQSHQEQILKKLMENETLQTAYQELMQNVDDPIHRMKKITDALNMIDAKTVRVTVCKEGKELSFKTDATSLKGEHKYYSTFNIPAADRREFEAAFGRYADFHAEDIVKISYGRRDIYVADQPDVEQQNDAGETLEMGGM